MTTTEEAAKVLELIENMKLELNSRELLLEKMRRYKELNESIPDISNVENCLEGVGLDQIATHFGSYYGYIAAAFDDDFDKQEMILRMKKYIGGFYEDHKIVPSLRAIAVNFTVNHLNEFSEKDIKLLIPDISEIIREVTPNISTNVEENSSTSDVQSPCPIIEKHRNTLSSRSDVKKLSDAERDEIIKKYRSVSVFLKKLKSY